MASSRMFSLCVVVPILLASLISWQHPGTINCDTIFLETSSSPSLELLQRQATILHAKDKHVGAAELQDHRQVGATTKNTTASAMGIGAHGVRINGVTPETTGGPDNLITFGSPPQPDQRLMMFRKWVKQQLSELPVRRLEARRHPGEWDHTCESQKEMNASHSALPKIPRHAHFVLIKERASWIDDSDPSRLIAMESLAYANLTGSEQLLIENMRYSMAVNRMDSVHFLDDEACRHATGKWSTKFQQMYDGEADLRFKSDICRAAALYWEGGYYFDEDMFSYVPVSLKDETEFATVLSVSGKAMFQSFLASAPCHPILARSIEMMLEARSDNVPKDLTTALEAESYLLGPVTLKLAWEETQASHTQLFHEVRYNPKNATLRPSDYGALKCEFVVIDSSSDTIHFCSRL